MKARQLADIGRAFRANLKVLFITGYAENAVISQGHLDHDMHLCDSALKWDPGRECRKPLIRKKKSH